MCIRDSSNCDAEANSIEEAHNGGFIVCGVKNVEEKIWVLRTNNFGDTLWTRTFGNPYGFGISAKKTFDGGYIITGPAYQNSFSASIMLIKIDDNGNILPDDEIGHIGIKITEPYPPGLFKGYYRDETKTTDVFQNGWYYTGDTATRDKDGYIWFVGRSDDIISSSSYRISPFEVESALIEHPAVAESAVVAKPDAIRGEIVKAFIILANGFESSEELVVDIQNFVKKHSAPYKYPREIEFLKILPKTCLLYTSPSPRD